MEVRIYGIKETNLRVLGGQKAVTPRGHFVLACGHRIPDIENVASKIDSFLTVLHIQRRILKAHVDG